MGWLYILVKHHQTRKQVGHKVSRRVLRRAGVSLKMLKSIFVMRGLKTRAALWVLSLIPWCLSMELITTILYYFR